MSSTQNRYPGINPHLNSYLQSKTGWKGFHTRHLSDIGDALEAALPNAYYIAEEESLQIAIYDPAQPSESRTVPDITIYRWGSSGALPASSEGASIPTAILPVIEVEEEEEYINSIVIYHTSDGHPVTRIELLSPANKPPGSHARIYQDKRLDTLRSGLRLVEIDYLHSLAPVIDRLPSYAKRDPGAYPYYILVSDPRPSLAEGKTQVFGFGILDKLPIIDIPLDGEDTVRLDFGTLYHQTFSSRQLFYEIRTDYTQLPLNFDAYTPEDQEQIRQFMKSLSGAQ